VERAVTFTRTTAEIESLLIDLDGTLIDSSGTRVEALEALDRSAGERYGIEPGSLSMIADSVLSELWPGEPFVAEFRRLGFDMTDTLWVEFAGGGKTLARIRAWLPEFRLRFWKTVWRRLGTGAPAPSEELAGLFVAERLARIRTFPGVELALARLRSAFRLVLVSNGPADLQRLKLERTGLNRYFTAQVLSGELAVAKPDPRIFRYALTAAGSSPQRTLMIGDDWRNDVLGARWVGIDAVFVATACDSARELDGYSYVDDVLVIASFPQLSGLLDTTLPTTALHVDQCTCLHDLPGA
jgi:HAD superfamily hydrolase (TIGR01509 family)